MKIESRIISENLLGDKIIMLILDNQESDDLLVENGMIFLKKENSINKLLKLSPSILKEFCQMVYFEIKSELAICDVNLGIILTDNTYHKNNSQSPYLLFDIGVNSKEWKESYSINTFKSIYERIIKSNKDVILSVDDYYHPNEICGFVYKIENEDFSLEESVEIGRKILKEINVNVTSEISQYAGIDNFTTLFEFPEALKTACKQYLVYFAQFLADIGINVDTSIKEEANKVLFTVITNNGDEALDKIKAALEVYINAPGNPESETISNESKDIAVLQWEANIYHLKSQIALQQAILQTKDATIEALQLSNYRLKEEITTAKQIEENTTGLKEEKFMGGTLAIKKYDGKWFSIDSPEFIRKLKRKNKSP